MIRAVKYVLLFVCIFVLGFVIYATIRHFTTGLDSQLKAGETAYAEGLRAFDGKDYTKSATRFDEALLQAGNILKDFENSYDSLANKPQEDIDKAKEKEGRAFWLKARAIRGQAFSKLAAEGKPLPAGISSASGEQVAGSLTDVSYRDIRDDELRRQAMIALRNAAIDLPDDTELQKEALFNETYVGLTGPIHWKLAALFATQLLKLEPANTRALSTLARYDYEQPAVSFDKSEASTPTPLPRRSRERMLKSRQYLAKLKEEEKPLRWPAVHLEGLIHQWMVNHYRTASQVRPAEELQEELSLRALLFDEEHGALRRADAETRLAKLSRADLDGMMALHIMAMDRVIEGTRRPGKAPEPPAGEKVLQVLDATMAMAKKLAGREESTPAQLGDIAEKAVISVAKAQPFLANEHPDEWKTYLDAAQALVQRADEKNAGAALMYVNLVELLTREATAQDKKGQTNRRNELRAQALKWADEGLRVNQSKRVVATELAALHEMSARMKIVSSGKREDAAAHLKAMRESRSPTAQGWASLLEGFFAEREGRLEKARELLEQAVRLSPGEVARRAHMILANVYMGLGQPDRAIASLREVDAIHAQQQDGRLSDEERQWYEQFVRSGPESASMQLQAHLAAARQKYQVLTREKLEGRGKDQLLRAIAAHEVAVGALFKRLAQSPLLEGARHSLVAYYAATERMAQAREELSVLKSEKPNSLRVLKQEVELLIMPPKGQVVRDPRQLPNQAEAERKIRDFMGAYPQDTSARLLYAQFLASTGRNAEAAAYVADRANFPDLDASPRLRQTLAVLQMKLGEQDQVRQLVSEMPAGQAKDRFEIVLAGSEAERNAKILEAMPRYENNGIFRYYSASIALSKKDYVEAAKGYVSALEYSGVRGPARQGLANTLMILASEDPMKAKDLIGQMLGSYPNERALLWGYAYSCLLLDDLGNPMQKADQIGDMSSALQALEQVALREGEPVTYAAMLKAQLWAQARRHHDARAEIDRALQKNPKHEAALTLGAHLALEAQDPGALAVGQQHLDVLRSINPDSMQVQLLQARYHEAANRPADAVRAYEVLIEKNPTASIGYQRLLALLHVQGQTAPAAKWLEHWRSKLPEDVSAAAAQVRQYVAAGQLAEAHKLAEQAVEDQVQFAHARLAKAPMPRSGDSSALLDNVRFSAQLAMGSAFKHAKAWPQAEQWAQIVVKARPDAIESNLLLGDLYLQRLLHEPASPQRAQWVEKAYAANGKVYALHKGHFIAGNNLACLLAREMNDPERALAIANEVRLGPYSRKPLPGDRLPAELLDTFGLIQQNLAKPELSGEMRDLFLAATRRYTTDPRMFLHLGRAYAGLKDRTKANDMFAMAIAVSKNRSQLPQTQRQQVIQEAEAEQKKLGLPPGRGTKPVQDP